MTQCGKEAHKDEEAGSGGWWGHRNPHVYHHPKNKATGLALNRGPCSQVCWVFTKRWHGSETHVLSFSGEKSALWGRKAALAPVWGIISRCPEVPKSQMLKRTLPLFWFMKNISRTYPLPTLNFFSRERVFHNHGLWKQNLPLWWNTNQSIK